MERSRLTSIDNEHENSAADAHMDAAEKIDHAKELVGQALTEIEDISRGMREKIVDERNPSYNESAGKKMPSEGEMQKADKCARDASSKEARRQSEQQYDWSLPVF
jgi:hypothetical protein